MIWLAWRQFRAAAWAVLAAVIAVAAALALTGPSLAHLYDASGLASCTAAGQCQAAQAAFAHGLNSGGAYAVVYFAGVAVLYLLPAIIGMFWGAPMLAREIEAGTLRLAWSQSVTRTRWLAAKLGLVGLAAVLAAGALSLAVSWWSAPIDRATALPGQGQIGELPNRFMPLIFGARGITPIGYAAFAFALGVAVGVVVRRAVPAMALTLAVLAGVQVLVPVSVRAHFRSPAQAATELNVSADSPQSIMINDNRMSVSAPVSIPGAWVISVRTVDAAGRSFTGPAPAACQSRTSSVADCDDAINGLQLRQSVRYQPAERFWAFQWYETAIYLALALALAGVCVLRIRRLPVS